MKKIIVSDYDKTFYLNDKDIELNKEMVNKFLELNNIFSTATGRSYFSLKKELDKFHFNYDYLIVNHGATILTKDNKVIANYTIDNDIINEIISDLDLSDSIKYIYYTLESEDMILKNNLNKINVQYKNKDKAMEIRDLINKKIFIIC